MKVINDDDDFDDFDDDDDERKKPKKAKFVSNDRSGYDDQFFPKTSKLELSSWGKRPFKVLRRQTKKHRNCQKYIFPSDVVGHFRMRFE